MRTLTSETRQKIFDAAARRFSVQRFHEVRIEDLAEEAGVGKGTVYRYFRDKEELYRDLIATGSCELLRIVEAPPAESSSPEAQLIAILAGLIDYFVSRPWFFDLFQHVETFTTGDCQSHWVEVRQRMFGRVETLLADPSLAVDDPAAGCLIVMGSIRSFCRFGQRPLPANTAERIVHALLHGMARRCDEENSPRRHEGHKERENEE